jgi:hypothetical protein
MLHGFSVGLAAAAPRLATWIAQSTRIGDFDDVLDGPSINADALEA